MYGVRGTARQKALPLDITSFAGAEIYCNPPAGTLCGVKQLGPHTDHGPRTSVMALQLLSCWRHLLSLVFPLRGTNTYITVMYVVAALTRVCSCDDVSGLLVHWLHFVSDPADGKLSTRLVGTCKSMFNLNGLCQPPSCTSASL